MRILFVSRFPPHPHVRDSGGQDTYRTIAELSRNHDVSLITFATAEQVDAVASMESICRHVVAVPFQHGALLPRMWRLFWRIWLPKVYGRNVSTGYRRSLRQLLAVSEFDVVVVDGMMALYGRYVRHAAKVLDEVDFYATVAYQQFANERRWLPKLAGGFEWLRTIVFELRIARAYDAILVRSEKDRLLMKEYLPHHQIGRLMPWFEGLDDLQSIPSLRPSGNNLLFVGAMNNPKNVEAVFFFANEVLPLIRLQVPDANLYVVGGAPGPLLLELGQREDVIVTGEVADLRPYYELCAVNVVPLLVGGGVIVKTLNGLAAARPTVATRFGNAGVNARDGRDLLIASTEPADFAAAVTRLLTDPVAWEELARSGRQFVQQNYDWQQNIDELEILLASLAGA